KFDVRRSQQVLFVDFDRTHAATFTFDLSRFSNNGIRPRGFIFAGAFVENYCGAFADQTGNKRGFKLRSDPFALVLPNTEVYRDDRAFHSLDQPSSYVEVGGPRAYPGIGGLGLVKHLVKPAGGQFAKRLRGV